MKLTPFIRSALYAETGAYTDRDAYISDMALSSVWGDAEDANVPAERLALLGFSAGGHLAAHYATAFDCAAVRAFFPASRNVNAVLLGYPACMPAVCGRDGGGDSGCKRTITKTKPVE